MTNLESYDNKQKELRDELRTDFVDFKFKVFKMIDKKNIDEIDKDFNDIYNLFVEYYCASREYWIEFMKSLNK